MLNLSVNTGVWAWLNTRKIVQLFVATMATAFFICAPLSAQVNTGRISGAITDQTGGSIAGAMVTVTNVARGEARSLTADGAGLYAAPNLTPGIYTVRGEFKGFQTVERQNIEVQAGGDLRVDLTLQPGAQTQTVTVTEALPIVNTTNAQTGGTLENDIITNLPSNGRNYRWMAEMVPGVFVKPGEGTSAFSVNGTNGGYGVNCLIDGLYEQYMGQLECIVGSQSESGDTTILPLDAIQEIDEVINPKAEYGWAPGVTQNIALKSGTNELHGSAYAFGRDQDLDARNAFATARSPLSFEQFGATLGGPIKKNKLFYFVGFEGWLSESFSTFGVTAPTTLSLGSTSNSIPDAIAGIINTAGQGSAALNQLSLNVAGCNYQTIKGIASPTTGAAIAADCTANQYGAPSLFNNSTNSTTETNTFPNHGESMNSLGKLDYRLNDHHSLNGSYFYGRYTALSVPYGFPATESFWEDLQAVQTQLGRLVEVWTPNSSWVNEARVGLDHDYRPVARNECTPPGNQWNTASGNGLNTGFAGGPNYVTQYGLLSGSIGCGMPSTTISGFTGQVGYAQNRVQFDTDTQGADTVSYTRGTHQFKFGTDVRAEHFIGAKILDQQTGIVAFGAAGAAAFTGATALEDFLAGVPSSEAIRDGSPIRNITTDKIAVFAQDDWRITSRVILNLGLRWEDETPARDSHGLLGNFDPTAPSGMEQTNQMWKNQSDWSPRLGVAWDVTGKGTTVVRGGGGIQYMIPQLIQFVAGGNGGVTGEDYGGEPTGATLYQANGITTIAPIGSITSGIISQVPITNSGGVVTSRLPWTAGQAIFAGGSPKCGNGLPSTANPAVINPPTCIGTGGDPNIYTGYRFYSWNLNVQHAFTNNLSLDVGYVGTHSADIPEFFDINQAPAGVSGPTAEQARRPYFTQFPWFSNINYAANIGGGSYNGLQMMLKQRAAHGLTFQASYTLSHGLAQAAPENSYSPKLDYGPLPFDALHHFAFTASYAIPGRKSPGGLLEGWGVNLSVNALSGLPLNASDSKFDTAGNGNGAQRWTLYGPASNFSKLMGGASTIPCFGVASTTAVTNPSTSAVVKSAFAASPCTTVAEGTGPLGSATLVANMPAACITAAQNEAAAPASEGVSFANSNGPTGLSQLFTVGCYFLNGAAIVPPAQGTFGTMTYDALRGPAVEIINAALTKDIKIRERLSAQFKAEAFNLTNNTWFAASQAGLGSPSTFGKSLSTPDVAAGTPVTGSGGPREFQLSLRLSW